MWHIRWKPPLALLSLLAGGCGGAAGVRNAAVGQLGLGRMEEADTHITVVLSNCSACLSMADDCKYGGSLSVCLSAVCQSRPHRFLSCVAARALPMPSFGSQLGSLLWSPSLCCPLGTGSWRAFAISPAWVQGIERSCSDL